MKLVSLLYKLARTANDLQTVAKPKRAGKRIKNKIIGRLIAKTGIWR